MELHKLLVRQIKKFVPDEADLQGIPPAFLKAISEAYAAYERDEELSRHAFDLTEQEYHRINEQLQLEVQTKANSIQKLKGAIEHLDVQYRAQESADDLEAISSYIHKLFLKSKRNESELSKNIKRITSLIGNLRSGILVENENREIVFTNETFCKIFGIPVAPLQLIGADCSSSAEETKGLFKDSVAFISRVNELLESKQQATGDVLEMADGRVLERDFVPVFVDEAYRGHLWNYTDITEKQRIITAVADSEAKSRLIMNSALDAIITINYQGNVTLWNPQAEKIFGWNEEEVLGKPLTELIIPENFREAHIRGMEHYQRTGEGPVLRKILELSALNKSGKHFPVELSITPIQYNGDVFFCAFMRDISERKKAENALVKSEEKYRSIIANMNLGLLEVNNEDEIQFCNQSFTDLSGYEFEELHGKKAADLFVVETHKANILDKNQLRQDGKSDSYEIVVRNRSGQERWWLISGAPNYNDQGEIVGSIGIHLDITQQKRLEQELEVALGKAQEASKAKEAFLANMSHEIRTPLNAIIGMIRELGREELSPKQQAYLSHSETASKHLLSIVNNILDISKIEAGELELESKDFSLVAVVNMVESILHIRAKEKGLQLVTNLSKSIKPALIGDGGRIRQILINIIGNAIKFTEKGQVSLVVEVKHSNAYFQQIYFKIEDTGIGMSPGYLASVFDKFSQEEVVSTKKYEGTGLGMSITKEIIHLMGGQLAIRSEKGKGTIVEIDLTLPIGDDSKIVLKNEATIDTSLRGLKCLLVEDNDMNRLIATKSLQHFGCEVTEATDGEKAIDLLKAKDFDFVLMDIQMPNMDGVQATQYIRNNLKMDIPIIALTANAFKSDIDRYLSMGMNDYITKPFEEHNLFGTIANTLNISTQHLDYAQSVNQDAFEVQWYNLEKIHQLSRGDESFVHKMVQIFVEHTPTAVREIQEAARVKDFATVSRLAHRMKPSIDSMGIQTLFNTIRSLEANAKAVTVDEAEIDRLILDLDRVITIVITHLTAARS